VAVPFFSRRTMAVFLVLAATIIGILAILANRTVRELTEITEASLRQDVPELVDEAVTAVTRLERHLADLLLDNGRASIEDLQST
ncbi:hypothetical protein J8J40_31285, partial [Mycobacterium tuberculosis]|nr:hypothetical protein [Mycobacterium tuberculosis]